FSAPEVTDSGCGSRARRAITGSMISTIGWKLEGSPGLREKHESPLDYFRCLQWSLVFAAPHTWWALGISAGFPGGEAKYHFFMSSTWRYVFDLVVIFLSVLAALVALTLLTAPQRSVWRRLAHVAAWTACGMLTLRGVAGFIHDGFSDRIWNPTFFIGGILYGGVALLA